MENYAILFPPEASTSSYNHHSTTIATAVDQLANFSSGMLSNNTSSLFACGLLQGINSSSSSSGALLGLKEEEKPKLLAPSTKMGDDDDHGTLESSKLVKKKAEKKARRQRYAFQTRSHVDVLDDGYRWRKYGQKAVKNNKFPRSYYRCTYQGCNVKKQVQRLSKDEGIVVTTYEGMHTHPIEKCHDNFEHILNQMQIYSSF